MPFVAEGGVPVQWLGEFAFGVVLLLFLGGWAYAKPAVDRMLRDYDRLRDENALLRKGIDEKVIPALEKNTVHLEQAVRVMDDRNRRDEQILAALDRLERR